MKRGLCLWGLVCALHGGSFGQTTPSNSNPLDSLILSIPDAGEIDSAYATPDPATNRVLSLDRRILQSSLNRMRDPSRPMADPETEALVEQAGALLLEGNTHQATRLFYRATRRDPDHPQALNGMAVGFSLAGDLERAAALYEALVQRYPDQPLFRTNLATVHLFRGDYVTALSLNPQALGDLSLLAGSPEKAGILHAAYFRLGRDQLRAGQAEQGLLNLLTALQMAPGQQEYVTELIRYIPTWHRLFHPDRGYFELDENDPPQHASYHADGLSALQVGQFRSAIFNLAAANLARPNATKYLNDLGVALRLSGYPRPAAVMFREVLRKDPSNDQARRNLLTLMPELGATSSPEIGRLTRAIEQEGANADLYARIAGEFLLAGDMEQAVVHYKSASELKPNDTRFLGAYLHALLLEERLGSAIDELIARVQNPAVNPLTLTFAMGLLEDLAPPPWPKQGELLTVLERRFAEDAGALEQRQIARLREQMSESGRLPPTPE